MSTHADPVLVRFRHALVGAYGERLDRVVLFGSRARGEAGADSDYDVAVFLHVMDGFGIESRRLAEIEVDVLRDTGEIINAIPLDAKTYTARTGFMSEVRRDGIEL